MLRLLNSSEGSTGERLLSVPYQESVAEENNEDCRDINDINENQDSDSVFEACHKMEDSHKMEDNLGRDPLDKVETRSLDSGAVSGGGGLGTSPE